MRHVALALLALSSTSSFASPDPARAHLEKIDAATIKADFASAASDSLVKLDPEPLNRDAGADYVVCMGKGDCARIVYQQFSAKSGEITEPVAIVLEYDASADNTGKVTDYKDSDVRIGRLDIAGRMDIVKRLLPSLEKDNSGFPAKRHRAYHPFNIHVVDVAGSGTWGQDEPMTESRNLIVSFTESTDGRAGGANVSYTYLVRAKSVDYKIVKFESQRLKMDNLLK